MSLKSWLYMDIQDTKPARPIENMLPTILRNRFFAASPCTDCDVPGYLVLVANENKANLAELSRETLDALGRTLGDLEAAIKRVTGAEHVYVLRFSEGLASVHFHLFPRTAELGMAWLSAAMPPDRNLNGPYLFGWARIRYHVDSPVHLSARTLSAAHQIRDVLQSQP